MWLAIPHRLIDRSGLKYLRDTRVALPVILLLWGGWMAFINPIPHSSSFARFEILPHEVWGLLEMLAGAVALIAIHISKKAARRRVYNWAWVTALIATIAGYAVIWIMLLLGNWTSTGTVTYGGMMIIALVNFLVFLGYIDDSE